MIDVSNTAGTTLTNNTRCCYKCSRPLDNAFQTFNGVELCPLCAYEIAKPNLGHTPGFLPAPFSWPQTFQAPTSGITARQLYKAAALMGLIANPKYLEHLELTKYADQAIAWGDAMADKEGLPK